MKERLAAAFWNINHKDVSDQVAYAIDQYLDFIPDHGETLVAEIERIVADGPRKEEQD